MRFAPSCGLLLYAVLSLMPCQAFELKTVTVVIDSESPLPVAAYQALQDELSSILSPSNIQVSLRFRSDLTDHEQFSNLVFFRTHGQCRMTAIPVGALSDERGPLAWTHTSNGELLPFGEVECDRLRESVKRAVGRSKPEKHESELGIAMARVMAHEMYHMFAQSAEHTHSGVAKRALSAQELTSAKLSLDAQATRSVRQSGQH